MNIRLMNDKDWNEVLNIYAQGLQTGQASFETNLPTWESWKASHILTCSLVAEEKPEDHAQIIGWASLSKVSQRQVYAGVAEVSIYISNATRGRGVGRQLLQRLVEASEEQGFWTLQASIFPENVASVRLHESCGFRVIGYREKIAQHQGLWRDTVLLERRSQRVGRA